jgi:outer membrane protein OmpA-like peptidoglycan-associated protein
LQPACIVDDRFDFDMTIVGLNVNAYNNYIGLKRDAMKPLYSRQDGKLTPLPTLDDPNVKEKFLEPRINSKYKSVYSSVRVNMPSFTVYANHKTAFAFTWDVRNYVNIDGVSPELAQLAYADFKDTALWLTNLTTKNFSVQQMAWAEYGLAFGHVIKEDNEHYFKAAGRAKFLQGIISSYMHVSELDYNFKNDTTLTLFHSEASYGHSRNFEVGDDNIPRLKTFESFPGFGADLGIVYEWRPDYKKYKYDMDGETNLWRRDQNKYKLRVGFSILDIGGIKFKKGDLSNNFVGDISLWNLHAFDSIKSVNGFDSTLKATFGHADAKPTYKMNLPTAISLQVDYQIWKDFYVNMTPYFAFQFKKNDTKVHDFSSISITPRWDHKWFGVFVPVQYHALDGLRYGATLRLGPVIFGTSNLGAIMGKKNVYGMDFHAMLKIPVPFSAPHDKDKDGVSNKKDKCKDVAGTWEFKGCPDKDGDHIQDSEDKCPDEPGLPEFAGCPDRDGDKITDREDVCPTEFGLAQFKGCPDRDGDSIPDKDDECPDEAGLIEYMGCPDKDADKTPDRFDDCPDDAGLAEFKGCPDRDGDKLPDKMDKCPDLPGTFEMQGCPWSDKDKDGIKDEEDGCPEVAGPAENKGCPWTDKDGDGVYDKDDDCPATAGPVENKGCPLIKKEEQEILEQAFEHLEFATGKDIIKKESYPSLNALAKLLVEHKKDWMLRLQGHTDNEGDDAKNMLLSKKRVLAVQKYLITKGVKKEKIITEWYGETRPIASNDTPEGRQKNRRVEMKVLFK